MTIAINTPNGNIGRALTTRMLDAGQSVVVLSRNPEKIADLSARGARLVEGSIDDEASVRALVDGADQLFWLSPPAMRPDFLAWGKANGERAAALAKAAGVGRVVVLSSVGAQSGPGVGPVSALLPIEDAFRSQIADVASLRAGFFMENLSLSLASVEAENKIYQAIAGDQALPIVATADVALRAGDLFLDRSWSGHIYRGVHGPEDLDWNHATARLREISGRPIEYVEVTPDQARQAMIGMGLPDFAAAMYAEMFEAMADGRMEPAEPRDAFSTTPTRFEDWARERFLPLL